MLLRTGTVIELGVVWPPKSGYNWPVWLAQVRVGDVGALGSH